MAELHWTSANGAYSNAPSSLSTTLLALVKARDRAAWQRFVTIYEPLAYGWCRRWGISAVDSADVVQDVFRTVWTQIGGFERRGPGDSFRGWLWTLTHSRAADHFRRRGRQPEAIGGTDFQRRLLSLPEADAPSTADLGTGRDMAAVLHRALDQIRSEFEVQTWTAFWRATIDGESSAEIGRDLGMTNSAVRQAKYRVLRRLRQELRDLCD